MLTVRLCGGLQLDLDGEPVGLPRSRRGRSLLAWLALHPGRHARGRLAGLFWPDVLDTSAQTSLRAALTELRAALGEGADGLTATRETVALESDQLWVDMRAFAELLDAGDDAGAIAACQGELLMGVDDDWVHPARLEHAARASNALSRLTDAAAAAGDHAAALAHAREAAALDPLAEEAQRRLMERLEAGGERAAALNVYGDLAERLRRTLGVAPSSATRALAARLRVEEPSSARAHVPLPSEVARARDVPFVGRMIEFARLDGLLGVVTDRGVRRLALLSGEPGIGKTRLALRFAAEPGRAATVLLGRCSEEPLTAYDLLRDPRPLRRRSRHQGGRRARRRQRFRARSAAGPCRCHGAGPRRPRACLRHVRRARVCACPAGAGDRRRPAMGRPGHASCIAHAAPLVKARPVPRHRDLPLDGRRAGRQPPQRADGHAPRRRRGGDRARWPRARRRLRPGARLARR